MTSRILSIATTPTILLQPVQIRHKAATIAHTKDLDIEDAAERSASAARRAQRVQKCRARLRVRCTRQFGIVAFTMPAR